MHVLTLRTWRDVSSNLLLLFQPTFGSSLCCPVPSKLSVMNPACTLAYEFCLFYVRLCRASNFDTVSFSFQRIEVYVKQNNFLDALELALSFYNGTAMAVIGNNRQLNGAVSQRFIKNLDIRNLHQTE